MTSAQPARVEGGLRWANGVQGGSVMNIGPRCIRISIVILIVTTRFGLGQPGPTESMFTYQGQLRSGGNPANGTFSMAFRLYDALTGGAQLGPTLTMQV